TLPARSAIGARAVMMIALFAVALGYFGAQAFAPYVAAEEFPDWEGAAWIAPVKSSSAGYYRAELILPFEPARARLRFAGPDNIYLKINGANVGGQALVSANTSDQFDIGPFLQKGKNILAIKTDLKTVGVPPALIARGYVEYAGGGRQEIATDEWSWRAVGVEQFQAGNTVHWYDPTFNHSSWPLARRIEAPKLSMQPVTMPWSVLEELPRGMWIWSADRLALRASLEREVDLSGVRRIEAAFLGVSSDADYALSINGFTIARAPAGASANNPRMSIIDIGPYLRAGANRVNLGLVSVQTGARAMVSLIVHADGRSLDFSSDSQWSALNDSPVGPERQPATVISRMQPGWLRTQVSLNQADTFGSPTMTVVDATPGLDWQLDRALRIALWGLGVFVALLVPAALCAAAWRDAGRVWAQASLAGIVLLAALFLSTFDVRILDAMIFRPAVFYLVCGFVGVWIFLALLGAPREGAHA
ncbi:MAG TPA: hypothetical protein VN667_18445, partial [Burkholderiales bacterium]|nr:hypothetical protein [Burkholderiales bacterium]